MQWNIVHSLTKKEILPFTTVWVNLEDLILSEISQKLKKKYCMISLTCNLKPTEQRIEWWLPGSGGREKWESVGQWVQSLSFIK